MPKHTRPKSGRRDPKWEIITCDPHDDHRIVEALREMENHGFEPKLAFPVHDPQLESVLKIACRKKRKRKAKQ